MYVYHVVGNTANTDVMIDYICTNLHMSISNCLLSTLCGVKFSGMTHIDKVYTCGNIHIYPYLIIGIHLCTIFFFTVITCRFTVLEQILQL